MSRNQKIIFSFIILFIGIFHKVVIRTPNKPEINPTINVSALNTLDISFFEALIQDGHVPLFLEQTHIHDSPIHWHGFYLKE